MTARTERRPVFPSVASRIRPHRAKTDRAYAEAVIFLAVVLHNGLGLGAGYAVGRAADMPEDRARACAFEVGLQNSGLAVALATAHFGASAALIPALFSVWHNVSGPALATLFTHLDDEEPVDGEEPAAVTN